MLAPDCKMGSVSTLWVYQATRQAAVLENTLGIHAAGLTKSASYVDPLATWD